MLALRRGRPAPARERAPNSDSKKSLASKPSPPNDEPAKPPPGASPPRNSKPASQFGGGWKSCPALKPLPTWS